MFELFVLVIILLILIVLAIFNITKGIFMNEKNEYLLGQAFAGFDGLEVQYTIRCAVCDNTSVEKCEIPNGEAIPLPSMPDGWHTYDGLLYCDKHEIMIKK